MTPAAIIGIDPGTGGAIAIFRPQASVKSGIRWDVVDMPVRVIETQTGKKRRELDARWLRDFLRRHAPIHAFIERAIPMPSLRDGVPMGSVSAFQSGQTFGALWGVLECCDVPYTLVTAGKWKAAYKLSNNKEEARSRALRLFPDQRENLQRVKDQGRAEAMLISNYGAMRLEMLGREAPLAPASAIQPA